MKKMVLGGMICLLALARGAYAQQSDPGSDKLAPSALSACEANRFTVVDKEMSTVYAQLVAKYKSNARFLQRLKQSQAIWFQYRDAQMAAVYYTENAPEEYGTGHPKCKAEEMMRLTAERTQELRKMLNPGAGNACAFVADK